MTALLLAGSLMCCAAALYIAVYLLSDTLGRTKATQLDWRVQRTVVIGIWIVATTQVLLSIATLTLN